MARKNLFCIALLSLTILSTELFWTRLLSAEFYYTFAFLVLSLAVLGLGLGALFLKMFPGTLKPKLLPVWLLLTGVMIISAVPAVFALHLDFTKLVSEPVNIFKLFAAIIFLGAGYFFGGMAIAHLFKSNPGDIPKLYMADLIGASLGVIAFIVVMNSFGASVTLICCAILVLAASFIMAEKMVKLLPPILLLGAAGYYILIGGIPEQRREERAPVIFKHWDATAKIKVYEFDSTSRSINIDNAANTPMYGFDGK